ncbi:MAG TPA: thiamine phosphate synthase [Polyangiales bacterium]|nr:thiamine phosphate synthase [Polyangiales bacterium]
MQGLYAIIDPATSREPLALAERVLRGGCGALQLRDKSNDDASFVALGAALRRICRAHGVPFIVNDRVWLAASLEADGVHIGQGDAPLEEVRRTLGPSCSIGVSTRSLDQALEAERRGADVIGFGPVFATTTRIPAEPAVGLAALTEVCTRIRIPVIAIGGLNADNVAEVARAGAAMGAVITALSYADDPENAARRMHAVLSRS